MGCGLAGLAPGLEFAKFRGAFVEQAMGLGAGAVDGLLGFFGVFVGSLHGVVQVGTRLVRDSEISLDFAAAAETPGGAADFVDQGVFEDAARRQFGAK